MAYGDIGPIIDTLHVEDYSCHVPNMCHVSGPTYALVFQGPFQDGWLKTVSIAPNGQISAPIIDSYEFDTVFADTPIIIKVANTTYVIAYIDTGELARFITLTIANDGTITKAITDSLDFAGNTPQIHSFIKIAANYFAVSLHSLPEQGWVYTIYIDDAGNIAAAITSQWPFDMQRGLQSRLLHIATTVYAICYAGPEFNGWLKTFTISDLGVIGDPIDFLVFNTSHALSRPSIAKATETYYAIAFTGSGTVGYICTVDIADDGQIEDAVVDQYPFDSSHGNYISLISAGDPYLAVCYQGASLRGLIKSFSVTDLGIISSPPLATLTFDAPTVAASFFLHVSASTFTFFYQTPGNTGHLKTVPIESPFLPTYALSGTVKEQGTPVARTVRSYIRSTGQPFSSGASGGDGTFSIDAPDDTTEMFVLAFDDDAGDDYNSVVYDRVIGVEL